MSDRDFQIGSKNYKISKIDLFKQYHISRKLGPILKDVIAMASKVSDRKEMSEEDQMQALFPLVDGLSKLSNEDAEYILINLLGAVEVQQPQGNWARLVSNGHLMFQDLDLPTSFQIAGRVFKYNMSGFLAGNP